MINVIFEDSIDLYWARTRVAERLNLATKQLPEGVLPTLGPDATGVGQIFWYTVDGEGYSLRDLRTLQDWFLRYQLNSVPGVAEVASVGGQVQQYQIDVDPNRLRAYSIPLSTVVEAVQRSNSNVGGNVIEHNGQWSIVRGVGLIGSVADFENIVIGGSGGTPIFVRNVADVNIGNAFRVGALDRDGKEAVGGVVIARYGVNTLEVINAVKAKLEALKPGLPQGVSVTPFYDRTELILRATTTLKRALIEELLLVTLAHIVFLFHFRSILIVTIPLPLAVLASFLFMHNLSISSNLMSLSGIAIAIGVLVDAGIVVTENAFRYLEKRGVDPRDRQKVWETVLESTRLVGRPIFFSMTIIILAFVPVFALTGREGKLFHPLAFTKTFAMLAATIIAVTLVPVLCTLLLRGRFHAEEENWVMRVLQRGYRPVLSFALAHRALTLACAVSLFSVAVLLATSASWLPKARSVTANVPIVGPLVQAIHPIGSEFMPELNEGDLMYMPITDPAISIDEALRVMQMQDRTLKSFPEVEWVTGKAGRAETSTDPAPVNMNETIVHLKQPDQWRPGLTREKLIEEMNDKLTMPGVTNIWTQPIINRIEMLTTGIRTEIGVKIYGGELAEIERRSREVATVLQTVPGAANVSPEPLTGQPYIDIKIDRLAAARYGIDVAAIQNVVDTGIGETNLTVTIEGRRRFPARVRYAQQFRASPEALGGLLVSAPGGAQIPLAQVATIREVNGASMISSENGLLRGTVLLNVRGRDVGSFVEEAKQALRERVQLPAGYYVEWSGQYEDQQRARARLLLVMPVVLVVIFVLLYLTYHSFIEAAHVLLAVPFALTGGVYLLYALGYNFSVAVWVGFIALFGTAVQTGMVMVIYLEEAVERKKKEVGERLTREQLKQAVMEGALLRLRPKVMTVSTVVAGLLPIMWSTSAGAEVMKPLATPVLGGMVSSLIHVLIVTPVIFFWLRERELKRKRDD
jgi:Cu(I)/Ag(I) efflux system membrane protein CusA/SilA